MRDGEHGSARGRRPASVFNHETTSVVVAHNLDEAVSPVFPPAEQPTAAHGAPER